MQALSGATFALLERRGWRAFSSVYGGAVQEFTIDELAAHTGLTPRNIRLYQTRGLISPPSKRGRIAVYDEGHLERLQLIQQMIADGMSRDLIQRVLTAPAAEAQDLLRLREAVVQGSPQRTEPQIVSVAELRERFGDDVAALGAAIEAGILEARSDGTFAITNPELTRIAERAFALGIPLAAILEIDRFARTQVEQAAEFFVEVMRRHIWEPFNQAGRPEEGWSQITAALDAPQQLPGDVYSALFAQLLPPEARRVATEVLEREMG